jgi:hypothetical protein
MPVMPKEFLGPVKIPGSAATRAPNPKRSAALRKNSNGTQQAKDTKTDKQDIQADTGHWEAPVATDVVGTQVPASAAPIAPVPAVSDEAHKVSGSEIKEDRR